MASELNIAGLQRKVDQSVSVPPVFDTPSSAQQDLIENPDAAPPSPPAAPESDKPAAGEPAGAETAVPPAPAAEQSPPEKH
jgi:hypothetical protein